MDESALYGLLDELVSGSVGPDEVVRRLRRLPYADLGFARVDHHRALRQGLPEAVYGPGKSVAHCVAIVGELLNEAQGGPVILTRASDEQAAAALEAHPDGRRQGTTLVWRAALERDGRVEVFAAGTADLVVAQECISTLVALGFRPQLTADCGVAYWSTLTPWPKPMPSSSSPGWRAPWPVWWGGSRRRLSWRSRRVLVMAPPCRE
jgi:hypothetical protein